MKLKLKPRAFFAATRDAKKEEKITKKLTQVSATVRSAQLSSTPVSAVAAPPTPPVQNKIKIKVTQKGGAKNLMLNPKTGSSLALPSSDNLKWKARSSVGRHLPSLQCNACQISRVCPKFKAGTECAYLPYLNSHKVESVDDLVKYMKLMCGNSMKRAQMMSIFEAASGGSPSLETSEALDLAFKQLKELHGVMTETGEQTVEIEGDATLVGSIFGGMKMEQLVSETSEMHKHDPVLNLDIDTSAVPLAESDVRAAAPVDVVEELVRDAIIGQSDAVKQQDKKSLKTISSQEIQQGELAK